MFFFFFKEGRFLAKYWFRVKLFLGGNSCITGSIRPFHSEYRGSRSGSSGGPTAGGLFHSGTMMVKGSFTESISACSGGTSSLSFSECTILSHWGTWPSFRAAVPPAASACRCLATTSSPSIFSGAQPRFLSFLFSTHKFVNTSRPTPAPHTLPLAESDITYVQSVESDRHLCSLTPQRPLVSKKKMLGALKKNTFHKHLVWHLQINSSTLTPDQCWQLTAMPCNPSSSLSANGCPLALSGYYSIVLTHHNLKRYLLKYISKYYHSTELSYTP